MDLVLTTAPTIELIGIDDLKIILRVDHSDEDSLILAMQKAAISVVEHKTDRSLLTQTWTLNLPEFNGDIVLRNPPIQSVTSVKYYDTSNELQTLTVTTDYMAYVSENNGRVYLPESASWPQTYDRPDAVQVEYLAGWTAVALVPTDIVEYIRLLIGSFYVNKETFVVGTITADYPSRFVDGLLDRYRVY